MQKNLHVTESYAPSRERFQRYVDGIWQRKIFTNNGPIVEELEEELRRYLQVNSSLRCVVNGAAGLHIILKALGLQGNIITTPFSYVATTACPLWEGLKVVYADIDPLHLTLDPNAIEAAINSETCAILATHVFGNPCDVEAFDKIGKKYNLPVIYDGAHAFGVRYKDQSILKWGNATMVSTHATKVYHTGEGGFIYSNDEALSKKMEWMRRFGHNGYAEFHGIGTNAKMSELHAALGLAVLEKFDEILSARKQLTEYYDAGLQGKSSVIRAFKLREECQWNYSYYPVLCESETALLIQIKKLNENRIFPRRYFHPALSTVAELVPGWSGHCPIAENIASRIMCLPLAASYSTDHISKVVDLLD